jgi:hypothetical protein
MNGALMADIFCKVEKGPNGGYIPLVRIVSPVLGTNSGLWFRVHPDETDEGFEYSMVLMAENAARRKAIHLLEQVNLKELAAGIIRPNQSEVDDKLRQKWSKYIQEQNHRVLKEHSRKSRESREFL